MKGRKIIIILLLIHLWGSIVITTKNGCMETFAKLIHRTNVSYLPTLFPVHFYGMPNGKIFVVFSRYYEIKYGGSGLEFIFALHKDYSFDYENERIVHLRKKNRDNLLIFPELLDNPEMKIVIVKITREINTYGQALNVLHKMAEDMKNATHHFELQAC